MARRNNTPVSDWVKMPLWELAIWIKANNELEEKIERERKK